jgi:hypothetical protein
MADHFQKLLVRPDIGFKRRDVEIADEDRGHALGQFRLGVKPFHLLDEVELVARISG